MMKLKFAAAATALLSAGGSWATTTDLGAVSIGIPTTFQGSVTPAGGFSDIFTFTLPSNGGTGYSVADFSLVIPGFGDFKTLFSFMGLYSNGGDGLPLTGDDVPLIWKPAPIGNQGSLSFPFPATGAGGYYLNVGGVAVGSAGGLYSGSISASPVPEPETYAMMLAGLGALGFLARRRKS